MNLNSDDAGWSRRRERRRCGFDDAGPETNAPRPSACDPFVRPFLHKRRTPRISCEARLDEAGARRRPPTGLRASPAASACSTAPRERPTALLRSGTPSSQPSLERHLALGRAPTSQEILDGDVFVELGPVDPMAMTQQPPIGSLSRRTVGKAWIPSDRNRDVSSVEQFDHKAVVLNLNALRLRCGGLSGRRRHSRNPEWLGCSQPPSLLSYVAQDQKSHGSTLAGLD